MIVVVGLSYRVSALDLLEKVAIPTARLPEALSKLAAAEQVREVVILSTCNRTELYAEVCDEDEGIAELVRFLAWWGGLEPQELSGHAYEHRNEQAVAHLFTVTSGLDSIVLGERQIQHQVKQAFEAAHRLNYCGQPLTVLFRQAIRVAKRIRNGTGVSDGVSSMMHVGVQAACRQLGDLRGRTVLIVGAGLVGTAGAVAVSGLRTRILIANRTVANAERLAERVGGESISLEAHLPQLAAADMVISATGSSHHVITHDAVAAAMAGRSHRPMVMLDLAVPRDIDPRCSLVPGVTVVDIKTVRDLAISSVAQAEVAKAKAIVEEETARFEACTRAAAVEPLISALGARAESIRAAELERCAPRFKEAGQAQEEALRIVTKSIVNRLHHEPFVRLREVAGTERGELYADAVRDLFGVRVQ